jgi:predicted phosphodiesterase
VGTLTLAKKSIAAAGALVALIAAAYFLLRPTDGPKDPVARGPWSLHADETSVVVRWDARVPSGTEITVEREGGGETRTFSGRQTAAEVKTTSPKTKKIPLPDQPGTFYRTEVEVTGLQPGVCYRYRLSADENLSGRFCTARAAGDSFKFLAIGDTNPTHGDLEGVIAQYADEPFDFSIHLGDIEYHKTSSWKAWFLAMAPILEAAPFYPCIGNHDVEEDVNEFADYYARLFGGAGFDSDDIAWYRFQSGGVWFFSLSSEHDLGPESAQGKWFAAQLADAAGRPGFRFSVVYFHRPVFSLNKWGWDKRRPQRTAWIPSFLKHGVKLVLAGHVHVYERFVDEGITYVVTGGGGSYLHKINQLTTQKPEVAKRLVKASNGWHGTMLEVTNSGIRGRAVSNKGELIDEFVIELD